MEAGMDEHLPKPFKAAALQAMLAKCVKPKADACSSSGP
jgi:CheY-like chemotaxis protein